MNAVKVSGLLEANIALYFEVEAVCRSHRKSISGNLITAGVSATLLS